MTNELPSGCITLSEAAVRFGLSTDALSMLLVKARVEAEIYGGVRILSRDALTRLENFLSALPLVHVSQRHKKFRKHVKQVKSASPRTFTAIEKAADKLDPRATDQAIRSLQERFSTDNSVTQPGPGLAEIEKQRRLREKQQQRLAKRQATEHQRAVERRLAEQSIALQQLLAKRTPSTFFGSTGPDYPDS